MFDPISYTGVSPIDPNTIPSLEAILLGDAGTFTTGGVVEAGDGEPIEKWVDQKNGHEFVQLTGANQPTKDLAALNSLATVVCDGINDGLTCTTLPAFIGTVITVQAASDTNDNRAIVCADTGDGVQLAAWYHKSGDPDKIGGLSVSLDTGTGAQAIAQASADKGVWQVYASTIDTAGSAVNFYKGQAKIKQTSFVGNPRPVGGLGVAVGNGYFNNARSDFFEGPIAAALMFTEALTDEQVQGVVCWLENRYAIKPAGEYVFSHFSFQESRLFMSQSQDGIAFKTRPVSYIPNAATIGARDPDIIYDEALGLYFMCHTNANVFTDACNDFVVASSPDLVNWTHLAFVDCSAIADGLGTKDYTWAPHWFVDPADSKVYVLVSISNSDAAGLLGYYLECTDLATGAFGAPTLINVTGLTGANIDWCGFVLDGTYYLFYKDDGGFIEYATAGSFVGPYTIAEVGDWAGFGSGLEGQQIIELPDGSHRIYLDALGANYFYSDSADDFATWSAKAPLSHDLLLGNQHQHGSVLYFPAAAPPADPVNPSAGVTFTINGDTLSDGVTDVTSPTVFYKGVNGGLQTEPNGPPLIKRMGASGGNLVLDGRSVAPPAVLYEKPDGGLQTAPNGKPLARVK